jgi:hypothetical protein
MASGDPFDETLISTADVLIRDATGGDGYGLPDTTFQTLMTGVSCLVISGSAAGKQKEFRAKSKETITFREVQMRPWFLDPAPDGSFEPYHVFGGVTYNTTPLTHHHWLLIPSSAALNQNGEATPGELYDIIDVQNPGMQNHHIEVWCQLVIP